MERLIRGVHAFHRQMDEGARKSYGPLAEGQRPSTLFVACADSRVVPAFISSAEPGELFTIRNVGNIIPCADASGLSSGDGSQASALEYGLRVLGVTDIVICGHSTCGAMAALLTEPRDSLPPNLNRWLQHARGALDGAVFPNTLGAELPYADQLSQRNVVLQLRALQTYPDVARALSTSTLRLHAWWFDIRAACVLAYDTTGGRFADFEVVYPERPDR